jgi:hypothetical protein
VLFHVKKRMSEGGHSKIIPLSIHADFYETDGRTFCRCLSSILYPRYQNKFSIISAGPGVTIV